MHKNAGRKWPIIIAVSTIGVIFACIATIRVAMNNPVELSDYGMQNYHYYDANVNEILAQKVAFDQKYTIAFLTPQISEKGTTITYQVTDKSGNAVDDAVIDVVLTRPDTTKHDLNLSKPTVSEGKYTFTAVDLPKAGRWDIMAKVNVKGDQRYYNIKADTRNSVTSEF